MSDDFDPERGAAELVDLVAALDRGDADPATLRRAVVLQGRLVDLLARAVAALIVHAREGSR